MNVEEAIAHLDLAIPRGRAVADDKVIRQSVLHVPNMAMVVVEHAGVALPRSAVVHDNELPRRVSPVRRRPIYLSPHRRGQITIARAAASAPIVTMKESIPKARALFVTAFLNC